MTPASDAVPAPRDVRRRLADARDRMGQWQRAEWALVVSGALFLVCVLSWMVPGVPAAPTSAISALELVCLAVGVLALRRANHGWRWICAALVCYWAADATWYAIGTPALSWADAIYMAFRVLLIVGALRAAAPKERRPLRFWLDTGVVVLSGYALEWYLVVAPTLAATPDSRLAAAVNLSYVLCDLALLFVLCSALLGARHVQRRVGLGWMIAGLGMLCVADGVYNVESLAGTYAQHGLSDAAWGATYWLMAAGLLAVQRAEERGWSGAESNGASAALRINWLDALPYAAVVVAYGVLAVAVTQAAGQHAGAALHGVLVLTAAATALVMARQFLAMRENAILHAAQATAKAEARFRSLVQRSTDLVLVVDGEGTVCYASPAVERMLGLTPEQVVGKRAESFVHADDGPRFHAAFTRMLADPAEGDTGAAPPFGLRVRHADGSLRHMESVGADLRHDPEVGGVVLNVRDVTERAESEARFRAIFEHAAVGIALADGDGAILEANPAFQGIVGYRVRELRDMRMGQLALPDDPDGLEEPVATLLATQGERVAVERRLRRADGDVRNCALTISRVSAGGGDARVVHMVQDVTEHRALQEELVHRAYHDLLTGLPNRARFHERVTSALREAHAESQHGHQVAVLLIDLDGFKLVNDTAGHAAGDALLRVVASRLLNATRGCDVVARLGGDEFGVLLSPVGGEAKATLVAERIINALSQPLAVHGTTAVIGASVGIARGGPADADRGDMTPADALLRDADLALYAAKAAGRGQYVVFEAAMHEAALERLALEGALRRGLDRGEFYLEYQPFIDLATGRVSGVEALVRWQHPTRGRVSPLQFIPLAEETGLIRMLGKWVLEEACRQGAEWARASDDPFSLTVNVSAGQLQHVNFVDEVRAALQSTGFPASRLVLELTESTVIHHPEVARQRLVALKGLGLRLAIDDFGTGYSALSHLRQFPLDVLKIDKSFVDPIAQGGEPAALASAIVSLGDALSLRTIAEGVETVEQMQVLAEMGCEFAQGYHFSRPVGATEIVRLLQEPPGLGALPALPAVPPAPARPRAA